MWAAASRIYCILKIFKLSTIAVIHIFLPIIQFEWATQFLLVLKVCNHSVFVYCMCDVFSNKWIEKSYDVISDDFGYDFKKKQKKKTQQDRRKWVKTLFFYKQLGSAYLRKSGKSQNQPKRPPKNCKTIWNDPKYQTWGNLEFSASFRFSKLQAKKYQLSNFLLFFNNFEPKRQSLGILGQKALAF